MDTDLDLEIEDLRQKRQDVMLEVEAIQARQTELLRTLRALTGMLERRRESRASLQRANVGPGSSPE